MLVNFSEFIFPIHSCKGNFKKSDLLNKAYYIIVGDDEKDESLGGAQCTKRIAGIERNIFITYSCDIDNCGYDILK